MTWSTSTRHDRLPADWPEIQRAVLERDRRRCKIRWRGCLGKATEVDHKKPGDDHSLKNLQAACPHCHGRKSAIEGVRARAALRARRKRPHGRHPGEL